MNEKIAAYLTSIVTLLIIKVSNYIIYSQDMKKAGILLY